jgi:hypothetical protein
MVLMTSVNYAYSANLNVCDMTGKCTNPFYTYQNIQEKQCHTIIETGFGSFMFYESYECTPHSTHDLSYCYVFALYRDSSCKGDVISTPTLKSFKASRFRVGENIQSTNFYQIIDTAMNKTYKSAKLTKYKPGSCTTPIYSMTLNPGNCYSTGSPFVPSIWFIGNINPNMGEVYFITYNKDNCEGFGRSTNAYSACFQLLYNFFNQDYIINTISSYSFSSLP